MAPSAASSFSRPDGRAYRRRACELCSRKKIKCDMLLPVCSNCKLYGSECCEGARRTKVARMKKRMTESQNSSRAEPDQSTESRLSNLEEQLQQVMRVVGNEQPQRTALPPFHEESCLPSLLCVDVLTLPPKEMLRPFLDTYFATINQAVPLFQEQEFENLFENWYNYSIPHNKFTWAAILITSAIGIHMSVAIDTTLTTAAETFQLDCAQRYATGAVSVALELASSSGDLLGVQVLLALTTYYNCVGNVDKASSLIAMAVSLAHRLQLHSPYSARDCKAEKRRHGWTVYWILFSLEKAISLRTASPSLLPEANLEIPHPGDEQSDSGGIILSRDGSNRLQYLRKTLDLKVIRAKITSAIRDEASQFRLREAQNELREWHKSIPKDFRIDNLMITLQAEYRMQMIKLYHSELLALVSAHGIFSYKAEWMRRLSANGKEAAQEFAQYLVPRETAQRLFDQEPPTPCAWDILVPFSQKCVNTFRDKALRKMGGCEELYCCALLVLMASMLSPVTDMESDGIVERAQELKGYYCCSLYCSALLTILDELCETIKFQVGLEATMQLDVGGYKVLGNIPTGEACDFRWEPAFDAEFDLHVES